MRTDAILDKKMVKLPYAGSYRGKWQAQCGDFVFFKDGTGGESFGRIIGRVKHAPGLDHTPIVENCLLVACLGYLLSYPCEKWVDPKDVTWCGTPDDATRIKTAINSLFEIAPKKTPIDTIRNWLRTGYNSFTEHLDNKKRSDARAKTTIKDVLKMREEKEKTI